MPKKERLNYIVNNNGTITAVPVNIKGVVIQADNLEDLQKKAKTLCLMMLGHLTEVINQEEPFELREFKEFDIWLYGEQDAEIRRELEKYKQTFGQI